MFFLSGWKWGKVNKFWSKVKYFFKIKLRVWFIYFISCKCIIRFVIWGRNILYFLFDFLLWLLFDLIVYYFLGMNEVLEYLDCFNEYNFYIFEDLVIRYLIKINDVFGDIWLLIECIWISLFDLRMEKNIKRKFFLRILVMFDWENWWVYLVVFFWDNNFMYIFIL